MNVADDTALWTRGVTLLSEEFSRLRGNRRAELVSLLSEVARLKDELVTLSDAVEGAAICAACGGACCRVGRYHPTPLDILAYLAAGETPEAPDFTTGVCPFLGTVGCRIAPSRRPVTCVIFVCGLIEERLADDEVARLHQVEEELRRRCGDAATRFGRSLTGSFLLEMERADRDGVPLVTLTTDGG